MFWARFFKRQEVQPGQVWRSGFNGQLTRVDSIEMNGYGMETVKRSVFLPVGHWARSENSDGWMPSGHLIMDRVQFRREMRDQRAVLVATDGRHPDGEPPESNLERSQP